MTNYLEIYCGGIGGPKFTHYTEDEEKNYDKVTNYLETMIFFWTNIVGHRRSNIYPSNATNFGYPALKMRKTTNVAMIKTLFERVHKHI